MSSEDASTLLSHKYAAIPYGLLFQGPLDCKKLVERKPQDTETAAKLEDMFLKIVKAFNERDFDPRNEIWQVHTDDMRMESGFMGSAIFSVWTGAASGKDFLQVTEQEILTMPDLKIHCLSRTATIDEKAGEARVMAYLQVEGHVRGVNIEALCSVYFRLIDEKWMIYRVRTVHGIDPLGM